MQTSENINTKHDIWDNTITFTETTKAIVEENAQEIQNLS